MTYRAEQIWEAFKMVLKHSQDFQFGGVCLFVL